MGDRANVFVQEDAEGNGIYLYTHWSGSELPETVRVSLEKKWRWNDSAYLARIVFCEMVSGNERGETGYGISTAMPDGANRVIVLDVPAQKVRFENRDSKPFKEIAKAQSFEGFASKNSQSWGKNGQ
jgi:hypothetical protein